MKHVVFFALLALRFGFAMSDDRMVAQDALKSDKGFYDGTEWPLGT